MLYWIKFNTKNCHFRFVESKRHENQRKTNNKTKITGHMLRNVYANKAITDKRKENKKSLFIEFVNNLLLAVYNIRCVRFSTSTLLVCYLHLFAQFVSQSLFHFWLWALGSVICKSHIGHNWNAHSFWVILVPCAVQTTDNSK